MEKTYRRSASVFCFTAFTLRYNLHHDNFILRVGRFRRYQISLVLCFTISEPCDAVFPAGGAVVFGTVKGNIPEFLTRIWTLYAADFAAVFGRRLALFDRVNPRPVYLAQSPGVNCANKCPLFPAKRMSNPRVEKSAPCELWHKFPLEIMGHRFEAESRKIQRGIHMESVAKST